MSRAKVRAEGVRARAWACRPCQPVAAILPAGRIRGSRSRRQSDLLRRCGLTRSAANRPGRAAAAPDLRLARRRGVPGLLSRQARLRALRPGSACGRPAGDLLRPLQSRTSHDRLLPVRPHRDRSPFLRGRRMGRHPRLVRSLRRATHSAAMGSRTPRAGQQSVRLHRGPGRQLDRDLCGTRGHPRPPGEGLAPRGADAQSLGQGNPAFVR